MKARIITEHGQTHIYLDDYEVTRATSLRFTVDASRQPVLELWLWPDSIEVEGDADVRLIPEGGSK